MCEINWPAIEAIGTCLTGLFLAYFACQQNQINTNSQKIELALRYQNHYKKLRQTIFTYLELGDYIQKAECEEEKLTKNDIFKSAIDNLKNIELLVAEAELSFTEEIFNLNLKIYNDILESYQKFKRNGVKRSCKKGDLETVIIDNVINLNNLKNVYKKYTTILSDKAELP